MKLKKEVRCGFCQKKLSNFKHNYIKEYPCGIEADISACSEYSKDLHFCNSECQSNYCLKMSKMGRKLW